LEDAIMEDDTTTRPKATPAMTIVRLVLWLGMLIVGCAASLGATLVHCFALSSIHRRGSYDADVFGLVAANISTPACGAIAGLVAWAISLSLPRTWKRTLTTSAGVALSMLGVAYVGGSLAARYDFLTTKELFDIILPANAFRLLFTLILAFAAILAVLAPTFFALDGAIDAIFRRIPAAGIDMCMGATALAVLAVVGAVVFRDMLYLPVAGLRETFGSGNILGILLWVLFFAILFGTQALFLMPKGSWRIRMSDTCRPSRRSAVIGGLVAAVISVGFLMLAYDLVLLPIDDPRPGAAFGLLAILVLLVSWTFWGLTFGRLASSSAGHGSFVSAVYRRILAHSLLQYTLTQAIFAWHRFGRKDDCPCATPSFLSLAISATVIVWLFGPGIVFLAHRRRAAIKRLQIEKNLKETSTSMENNGIPVNKQVPASSVGRKLMLGGAFVVFALLCFGIGRLTGHSSAASGDDRGNDSATVVWDNATSGSSTASEPDAQARADAAARAAEEEQRRAAEAAEQERQATLQAKMTGFNEAYVLAQIYGTSLDEESKAAAEMEFYDAFGRDSFRIRELSSRTFTRPELDAIKVDAGSETGMALMILNRINQIGGNMPANSDLTGDGLLAILEGFENRQSEYKSIDDSLRFAGGVFDRIEAESAIDSLEPEYREHDTKARWIVVDGIKQPLVNYSGDTLATSYGIEYYPAWQGAYPSDMLVLSNQTGADISDAVVHVSLSNSGYRSDHLHYVRSWPGGTNRYASYRFWRDDYRDSQTLNGITKVTVSVYTPNTYGVAVREYSQSEIDAKIREYLGNASFTGGYIPYSQGFFGTTQPGISLEFSGLSRLPVNRVDVTFESGGRTDSLWWDYTNEPSLVADQEYTFNSPQFDFVPQSWTVKLTFAGTNETREASWTR